MNKDTYDNMLKDYEYIKDNQAKCRRIQKLLLDEKVKEFIKLSNMDYSVIKSGYHVYLQDEVIKMLIDKTINNINYKDNNKIYVLINSFKVIDNKQYYFKDESLGIDYRTYHNLEAKDVEVVPYHMIKRFEKNNKVIINHTHLDNELFYKKVQLEFFKYMLKNSQRKSKELILKKY